MSIHTCRLNKFRLDDMQDILKFGLHGCLQIYFQYKYFIPDPIQNDVKYQARAQPFLVFGLLTTGLAIGQSNAL